eukprot:g5736.t1
MGLTRFVALFAVSLFLVNYVVAGAALPKAQQIALRNGKRQLTEYPCAKDKADCDAKCAAWPGTNVTGSVFQDWNPVTGQSAEAQGITNPNWCWCTASDGQSYVKYPGGSCCVQSEDECRTRLNDGVAPATATTNPSLCHGTKAIHGWYDNGYADSTYPTCQCRQRNVPGAAAGDWLYFQVCTGAAPPDTQGEDPHEKMLPLKGQCNRESDDCCCSCTCGVQPSEGSFDAGSKDKCDNYWCSHHYSFPCSPAGATPTWSAEYYGINPGAGTGAATVDGGGLDGGGGNAPAAPLDGGAVFGIILAVAVVFGAIAIVVVFKKKAGRYPWEPAEDGTRFMKLGGGGGGGAGSYKPPNQSRWKEKDEQSLAPMYDSDED